jgi:hydrogenase maturation protein HypF
VVRPRRTRKKKIIEAPPVAPLPERRMRLQVEGMVQGVGFRPWANRLAHKLSLAGWVANSGDGVTLEIEGPEDSVEEFLDHLRGELPPLARLDRMHTEELAPAGDTAFTIRESLGTGTPTALVLPDVGTCVDCLRELFDAADRRYRYPFTNCTHCGPRFSILEALPYDRANTTMRHFDMCAACRAEYETPADRRFHAQPNACPDCGPQLGLLDAGGSTVAQRDAALIAAVNALRDGRIVALKGLGGFQLLVDAHNADAITRLRQRKQRPQKPFAVVVPSLAVAETICYVSVLERELLTSPQAPIVLLRHRVYPDLPHTDGQQKRKTHSAISDAVAPYNPLLGIMLPYTPLHHLLLSEFGFSVVATSGNLSDEPMATDNDEALERLGDIADVFLVHDRPIACALDDSVVRVIAGRAMVLRRARGYAPLPVPMHQQMPPLLALGGHLKSAVATTVGSQVMVGPYVGDLDSAPARKAFNNIVARLSELHAVQPRAVVCDKHPGYYTTQLASRSGAKVIPVQHHVAHIASCMADNGIGGPVLGVAWDGTGYGDDGTIWGGEFIGVDGVSARRVAHLRLFSLPGGDKAVTEPRRAAIGALYELFGADLFDEKSLAGSAIESVSSLAPLQSFSMTERKVLAGMLARNLNAPRTSSIGRLFDAVASLTGLVQQSTFEGHAAMALEFALDERPEQAHYTVHIETGPDADSPMILDWHPMLRELLADIRHGEPVSHMAAAFHNCLVEALVAVAERIGETRIVLTGGCFQNRYLTERAVERLRHGGFEPLWHQHVPPNDGGLALGQAVWAARLLEKGAA